MNNDNQEVKITEYADTAYKGKADPYYRENIAGPDQRKRHLAKGQCQLGVFPRVSITGICWDKDQEMEYKEVLKGRGDDIFNKLNIADNELRLPLHSLSQNTKEVFFRVWELLQLVGLVGLPTYLLIMLGFGGWKIFLNNVDVLAIGIISLLVSKYFYRLLDKFNITPSGQYVIFNRETGMVEIANDERTGYHHIPFEQFNAHHRTVHSERGAAYYGFTLLHYQQDLMYQVADYASVIQAIVHWELIKDFMDTSQPLADIPQFERYRSYDPITIAYDKMHGRPDDFWYRVDKIFMKKVSNIAYDIVHSFPSKNADTLREALQHGYKVPDIVQFPWREAGDISEQHLTLNSGWFSRYIFRPLFLY